MSETIFDGRYTILRSLGEGGMGTVFLAQDARLETTVVIKIPHRRMLHEPGFVERFQREVRSLVRLSHPHIVSIIDVGEHDGSPYSVMQYLGGGSLSDRRAELAKRTVKDRVNAIQDWLPSIATALDFIHVRGYIHRDIKPANILFDDHGHAFLSDFGIAKVVSQSEEEKRQNSITAQGIAMGTPEFMAPELCKGLPIDGRVDQYALAVTIYEMIAGKCPLVGPTPLATIYKQGTDLPKPLDEQVPGFPAAAARVVGKGLAKDPKSRFADCQSLSQAFFEALSESSRARVSPSADVPFANRGTTPDSTKDARQEAGQTNSNIRSLAERTRSGSSLDTLQQEPPTDDGSNADSRSKPTTPISSSKEQTAPRPIAPATPFGTPVPVPQSTSSSPDGLPLRQATCSYCSALITIPSHWSNRAVRIPCPSCRTIVKVQPTSQSDSSSGANEKPPGYRLSMALSSVALVKSGVAILQGILLLSGVFFDNLNGIPLLLALCVSLLEKLLLATWTINCWISLPPSLRSFNPLATGLLLLVPGVSSVWQLFALPGFSIQLAQLQASKGLGTKTIQTGLMWSVLVGVCSILIGLGALVVLIFEGFLSFNLRVKIGVVCFALATLHGIFLALWTKQTYRARQLIESGPK